MLKFLTNQAIITALLAVAASEAAMARTAEAVRPAETTAVRPSALGATGVAASMSAAAASATVNQAIKGMVVGATSKQKLVDGLSSSNSAEVKAAQRILAELSASDMSRRSQALSALASRGSIVEAAGKIQQNTSAVAQQGRNETPEVGGTCQNMLILSSASSAIVTSPSGAFKDCGLERSSQERFQEVVNVALADGAGDNDAQQMAEELAKGNPQAGKSALETLSAKCVNFNPRIQKQIVSLR